ncbi:hypothetical protein [Caldanaerobacter subterraneus]|uniref:Uncharacterized protein n=1 Tax=Caldanaerobacter subterraneus TaxID=911092 RepID=A0A7Y2L4X7_9THEO|nr:hypothetical protein [Caldanaerobacter subterraneus]NNG65645.1 hypothetical protein [Caldanaerobacter subterraneus]
MNIEKKTSPGKNQKSKQRKVRSDMLLDIRHIVGIILLFARGLMKIKKKQNRMAQRRVRILFGSRI